MTLKTALIGYTGFVGGNLLRQHAFDALYNSKNIDSIAGRAYDWVACAAAPAEKWKANQNPTADWDTIQRLMDALRQVKTQQLLLISTVDVYPVPVLVDENSAPDWRSGTAYGRHRRLLEEFALAHFPTLIIRLPGLFGTGLKKNIVYDFLHGHQVDKVHADAQFQFYGLETLWPDIAQAQRAGLSLLNMATEPVSVAEVSRAVFGREFQNRPQGQTPARYDMRSLHAALYGGAGGYLQSKERVLSAMKKFVSEAQEHS